MIAVTVRELIESALGELDHPDDCAALPLWQEKLLRFANEAVVDLYETFRPWRRDPLPLQRGVLDLTALPYSVGKVLGTERGGMRIPFYYGADTNTLRVPGVPENDVIQIFGIYPWLETLLPQLILAIVLLVTFLIAHYRGKIDAIKAESAIKK